MIEEWDPCAWAASIAASLSEVEADEALVEAVHAICQSPPWHESTVWTRRLYVDVPKLAVRCVGVRALPSIGMDLSDVIAEMQQVLLVRSRSPASRWDPERGYKSWAGWCVLVMRSRWSHLLRATRAGHVSIISYANQLSTDEDLWSAEKHIHDEDNSPWLTSRGRPSRAGLRRTGRPMGRPRLHPRPESTPSP